MPGVKRDTVIRGVTPKELYDVVVDYAAYPRYFTDFSEVNILAKDEQVLTVEFNVQVVKKVSYTLRIVHDPEALKTRWTFVRGKLVSESKGGWSFTEVDGGARVDYDAEIDISAPLPGFVKRKIQDSILNRSIASMFTQLEQEARRRR